ncbi:MAG: glycosyltransferase [Bacteroidota bacterium]
MDVQSGISVIICCYNSAERIEEVLLCIQKQRDTEHFPWEVILVDNASGDRTSEVAEASWTLEGVPLNIVFEYTPGLSAARVKGLRTSRFPVVVFVDDDNLIAEDYISRAYHIMTEHKDVGLAGGLGIPVTNGDLPPWFASYQDAYAVGPQAACEGYVPESRSYLHGAGLIMRKNVWDLIVSKGIVLMLSGRKGKSLSSGEDYEISLLFRMAGFRMWYDSKLEFKHILPEARLHWNYLRKLQYAFGRTQPLIELIKSVSHQYTGLQRIKSRIGWIGLLVRIKELLMLLPRYLWIKVNNREGQPGELGFLFCSGAIRQQTEMIFKFARMKRRVDTIQKDLAT